MLNVRECEQDNGITKRPPIRKLSGVGLRLVLGNEKKIVRMLNVSVSCTLRKYPRRLSDKCQIIQLLLLLLLLLLLQRVVIIVIIIRTVVHVVVYLA